MGEDIREAARAHLVPHFTRASAWQSPDLPVIVRGEGCYVYDDQGRRFLDGLSGLFCVNIGHGRSDIAAAAAKQMETLAYATNWSAAHPASIEAASLIAGLAPGDLDAVFFVSSGSEAVESAIKFARQYHRSQGQAGRTKVISREMSYHGTTMGALSVTGLPSYREPFEPLLPGVFHVPNTLGATVPPGGSARDLACVEAIEEVIEREGADTIAAIFAEPVQNGRGALVPPEGYWAELRAICDRHGILLVADEVINSFGRLGRWFGVEREGVVPDLLTFAKGSTSGYAPLGGLIARRPLVDRLFEAPDGMFSHGATWGGHPVSTTVAIANIHALADEHVLDNVQANAPRLAAGLNELVGRHRVLKEVRGTGYFYALELMADSETGRELTHDQSTSLLRSVLPAAMRKVNLLTRPDDRGATMLVLAPPLIADAAVVDELLGQVDAVLDEAGRFVNG
ncbi:MAG: aspartate aminotransferase family protein [Actinomycetota bacterium]|jgi:adenosylmethionine-8-amino-7-oxononanoate aminotransferase|nr:aspartate aminotransferase family protein [Actinomycetota bacterium]